MVYAIVEDGNVVNIAESTRQIEPNWYAVPIGSPVGIGDSYDGKFFYAPDGTLRLSPDVEQIALALEAMMGGIADA